MPWLSNLWVRVTLGAVAVAVSALVAVAVTGVSDAGDDPPAATTVPTADPVARALSGPAADVADPQVVAAIRQTESCLELERMAASAREAAERFGPDDPRQPNAVYYLTEAERQLQTRSCAAPASER